jgi:hypothetical protein
MGTASGWRLSEWIREANPVLTRELRVRFRGAKGYCLMALSVLAASGCLLVPLGTLGFTHRGVPITQEQLSELARTVSLSLFVSIAFILDLSLPGMLGGAIAMERSRRTFAQIILTRLSDWQLAEGKLLAALVPAFIWAGTALPVFCITSVVGGVGWEDVLVGLCVVVTSGLSTAAISLWISSETRNPLRGVLCAYITMLILRVGLPAAAASSVGGRASWLTEGLAPYLCPWAALVASSPYVGRGQAQYGPYSPMFEGAWAHASLVALLVAVCFVGWAALRLRLIRQSTPELFDPKSAADSS